MEENQYLNLLRGINVGGNNIIKMADLKRCFEDMGFTGVLTFIQSGNVIFTSIEKDKTVLAKNIEKVLSERFKYKASIVLMTHRQLKTTVSEAPEEFGKDPDKYKYDVLFIKEPHTPDEIIKNLEFKEGVDKAFAGEFVLYFSRLRSRASQSRLTRIITLPVYQYITVRNWNTTCRLLTLVENDTAFAPKLLS